MSPPTTPMAHEVDRAQPRRERAEAPAVEAARSVTSARTDADASLAALASLDALAQGLRGVEQVKQVISTLIAENARLRSENTRLVAGARATPEARAPLTAPSLAHEKAALYRAQIQGLLDAHAQLERRVAELDWANSSMMSMYVSSFQLHASLELQDVLGVIEEIIVNFVGVRSWAVLVAEQDGTTYRVARESGLEGRFPQRGIEPQGILADVLGSGSPYLHPTGTPSPDEALAVVPLLSGKTRVGAILIYSLLPHKEQVGDEDLEMFSFLGGHAASALASAMLYEGALERTRTLESMVQLVQ